MSVKNGMINMIVTFQMVVLFILGSPLLSLSLFSSIAIAFELCVFVVVMLHCSTVFMFRAWNDIDLCSMYFPIKFIALSNTFIHMLMVEHIFIGSQPYNDCD